VVIRPFLASRGTLLLSILALLGPLQAPRRGRPPGNKPANPPSETPTRTSRADRYFAICDQDGNLLISFKEAQASLGLDQAGFAVYDTDADGMISPGEFRRRYLAIVDAGGAFAPPKPKAVAATAIPSSAKQMLEVYDKNLDGALDGSELDTALVEIGASRLDPEALLEQLDHDGSGELEPAEIDDLLTLLKPGSAEHRGPPPKSVDELFGKSIPRSNAAGTTPQPPYIGGPVGSFRRLDLDGDGHVTLDELNELQRPFALPVRPAAVLAALDTDGDGTISAAEFRAAMGSAR
jgi:Ca2+-binding EF-hand superfamily protein